MKNISKDLAKQKIIHIFNKKVRGKKSDTSTSNQYHDGKDGHWLETQMGVKHNGSNSPDLFGFEMKNHTGSKTSFGDWSPDFTLFKKKINIIDRTTFLHLFGAPNIQKNNRYSWSGKPVPRINKFNDFGQKLTIDKSNNILAVYSYKEDKRKNKKDIMLSQFKKGEVVIASWSEEMIRNRVENKFNKFGWFKCFKNRDGIYDKIGFGNPITFKEWIKGVKTGLIYFDCGMYEGNPRPYSQWRADNKYWDSLIVEKY